MKFINNMTFLTDRKYLNLLGKEYFKNEKIKFSNVLDVDVPNIFSILEFNDGKQTYYTTINNLNVFIENKK